MYFDQQIGVFTIASYATCFENGEDFNVEDSEEESVDDTLQAALTDERQITCSSASQKMGVPGTSFGSGGALSMAVSTDPLMTRPLTSSIVTPTQMAGNTMTVSSRGILDLKVQAMLSPELLASLSVFANNPSTVLEFLRSRTPQQPPSDEPLEHQIGDRIPADIAQLPGPIVCRHNHTYLEEFYDRGTSPAYGYNWHVEEDLEHREGERKGASGGGAHGKGSESSGGAHGKGLRSRSGASGKGPGPRDGASGKDVSRGELQKNKRSQGRQATEGKGSGSSGGGHGKGSGLSVGASAEGSATSVGASGKGISRGELRKPEMSHGPKETERKGSGSSGGGAHGKRSVSDGGASGKASGPSEGSHGRVEHDSGPALERSRLDQAKKLTVELNPKVGSSHGRVKHDSGPTLKRSRLDQAKKLTVESNPIVGSGLIDVATGKASGPRGGSSTVGGISPIKGSHSRVKHGSRPTLQRSRLDQAKKLTVESNPTAGSGSIAGASGKTSGPSDGGSTAGSVSPVKGSHGRVEHDNGPLLERSQLDQAEKLVVESNPTLEWGSIAGASAKAWGRKGGVSGKDISPADQVWGTTMLVGDSVTMKVDITGTLTELQMSSSTMPAEVNTLSEEVEELSPDTKIGNATAGVSDTFEGV
ncbi:hypothetical protein CBR_g12369 [Chara braunii]|uniref:Uncharacterized protein n=1 Tax=Chara braunii TaxID=69332 RepID=A0A388KRW1_CHABU|nr:hypothetical protein CBR_g12369 [Chara braunii]|eukprot:GBG72801.1 hypothetical protein CBR_g12369 [Chara braunii]